MIFSLFGRSSEAAETNISGSEVGLCLIGILEPKATRNHVTAIFGWQAAVTYYRIRIHCEENAVAKAVLLHFTNHLKGSIYS